MGGMIAQRVGARPNFGGGEISPKLGERGEPFKALGSTERVGAMLESMHELSGAGAALGLVLGALAMAAMAVNTFGITSGQKGGGAPRAPRCNKTNEPNEPNEPDEPGSGYGHGGAH